jgi:hypothetical protein
MLPPLSFMFKGQAKIHSIDHVFHLVDEGVEQNKRNNDVTRGGSRYLWVSVNKFLPHEIFNKIFYKERKICECMNVIFVPPQ